jgi:uncharacterized protein (TIGR02118 family)
MYKLIALYAKPDDADAFDKHYTNVHLPLVKKIPGLARVVVNRAMDAPWGGSPPYYQMVEMHFPDEETFRKAMASAENAAAGRDARGFAGKSMSLMVVREV